MTQDDPEREKAKGLYETFMLSGEPYIVQIAVVQEIERLQSFLSAAEKRAEEAEADMKLQGSQIAALVSTIKNERDDARAERDTALVISNNYQSLMVTAQRERDELRSSLARVVEDAKKLYGDAHIVLTHFKDFGGAMTMFEASAKNLAECVTRVRSALED